MKCVSCNEEIQDLDDITQKGNLCDKCKNNEVRQDFYKTMKLLTDQKGDNRRGNNPDFRFNSQA